MTKKNLNFYDSVYALCKNIPYGKVTTYGSIAKALGKPRGARAVGYALLHGENIEGLPWQRIINAKGRISGGGKTGRAALQKKLLENEGVVFREDESVDFSKYYWRP